MRPEILTPLFRDVKSLPGVGPRTAKHLERLCGTKVIDLLWHLPREIIDRRFRPPVAEAPTGRIATLSITVDRHEPPHNRRQPYRVRCSDESGELTLVYFHAEREYLHKILPEGSSRIISGTIDRFRDEVQITHPDYVLAPEDAGTMPLVEPIYPLTEGLTLRVLGRAVREALKNLPALPEWLDEPHRQRNGWPAWREAVVEAHSPADEAGLAPGLPARARLAYDELLANQLALLIIRARHKRRAGRSIRGDGQLRQRALAELPFGLTGSQRAALGDIESDMADTSTMLRLLQGDVGSGKTIVALLAMLNAVECGGQAALMAPTEILARQHHATIEPIAASLGLSVGILTGREKGAVRKSLLEGLADGSIQLVVGTHALFQDAVAYHDLMLAVIDEQHRFGVHQRLNLAAKGKGVDVLVMTATPIPRTLLMTAYGDLEASQLREKPPGRKPIDTRTVPLSRIDEVIAAIGRKLDEGAKVYWVCPLVEESEVSDLAAAEERYAELRNRFGETVALVHGRMKGAEKDEAMARFADGPAKILVATTVIEVGVDVPDATVMVIERAERFGLAQLHQLRGRIGRGDRESTCLLLYGAPLGETARARLTMLRESEDGFRIAEEDLRLRGGGEILGTRQSGMPSFRLADLAVHAELLGAARDDAKLILTRDPDLTTERGKALRVLLYLFERDAAVVNLRSG